MDQVRESLDSHEPADFWGISKNLDGHTQEDRGKKSDFGASCFTDKSNKVA